MKTTALLLAAALLAPAAGAFAQSPMLVAAAPALAPAVGGSATYFGLVSSHDAQHEQFARLRQAFAASRPTLVLIEKPDQGTDSTEAATLSRCGEAGYARLLAQQHGVRTERLDDPEAEYAYLRARTEPTTLKLYYLLRSCRQLHLSAGASKATLKQALRQLLATSPHFLPGTEHVVRTEAEFVAAYRQLAPGAAWWQPALGARPAEAFVQRLDEEAQVFRAQRLRARLAALTEAGERVLVVLDRRDLPAAPATYAVRTQPAR